MIPALTRREKAIVLYVLLSLVIGLGVKRWREHRRESEPVPASESAERPSR